MKHVKRLFTFPAAKAHTRFVRFVRPALAVLALVGSVRVRQQATDEGRDVNAYDDPLIVWLPQYAVVYLLTALALVVGRFVLNAARPDRPLPERLVSPARVGVFGATVLVIVLAAAVGSDTSSSAASGGSDDALVEANLQAQEWSASRVPVLLAFNRAALEYNRFVKQIGNGNTAAARQLATDIESGIDAARDDLLALPEPVLPDFKRVDAQYARGFDLAADAFADYGAALRSNAASGKALSEDGGALALLDQGDEKWNRAQTILTAQGERLLELNEKYGGKPPGE